jgi:hypothetical protein
MLYIISFLITLNILNDFLLLNIILIYNFYKEQVAFLINGTSDLRGYLLYKLYIILNI